MVPDVVAFAGGFFVGQLAVSILSRWVTALYRAVKEYRASVAHPNLGHRTTLWIFLPLLLLHSGPYALGLLVFGAFKLFASAFQPWHAWLIGGFVADLVLMVAMVSRVLIRRKASKGSKA